MGQETRERPDRRDEWIAGTVWAVLSIGGEIVVWGWLKTIMPPRYAETSTIVDDAFLWLSSFAVPVFAFVFSFMGVSLVRHRREAGERVDGTPVAGSRRLYTAWFAVTGGLCLALFIFPGLVGMSQIHRAGMPMDPSERPLVVEMTAAKWAWGVTYPELGIQSPTELVLPEGRLVRFDVRSLDILHSFWIPAFRVKIDAVPGKVTRFSVTPERVGSSATDPLLRVQCAELCGLHHSTMSLPVRVLPAAEFDAWLLAQGGGGGGVAPACEPKGTALSVTSLNIVFDTGCLAAPADTPFTIAFDNQDPGIPHNVSIATSADWADVLFTGELVTGVVKVTYEVPALPAGTYVFRCDVHPTSMIGQFIVQ